MKNIALVSFFIILVSMVVWTSVLTSYNGTLRCGIIPKPRYSDDFSGEGHRTNDKAIFNGKQVEYYAASFERCDELYKYCHCIGQGYIQGFKNPVYLYVPNDNYRLITTDQLLAEQKGNLKIQ